MVDEPDNLTQRMLRSMDFKLDHFVDKFGEMKTRVGRMERESASSQVAIAEQFFRMYRIDGHLDCIERRVGLVESD